MVFYTTWLTWVILIGYMDMTYTGDVFTSTAQMRKLVASEEILRVGLDTYISSEELRIAQLKR